MCPLHTVLLDSLHPGYLTFVQRHADNSKPFVLEVIVEFHHVGILHAARSAPGSPEIDNFQFSFHAVERHLFSFWSGQGEVGSGGTYLLEVSDAFCQNLSGSCLFSLVRKKRVNLLQGFQLHDPFRACRLQIGCKHIIRILAYQSIHLRESVLLYLVDFVLQLLGSLEMLFGCRLFHFLLQGAACGIGICHNLLIFVEVLLEFSSMDIADTVAR